MVYYREVQPARQWWITLLLMIPLAITGYGFCRQIFLGQPWGTRPVPDAAFILIEAGLVAFVVWIHLIRLITEVREDALVIRYAWLWPVRRIPLRGIKSARDITYRPIFDYGGWGVRWAWDGSMIYNASGNRGVELILDNGKHLVVGSQRATELARAIASRL